MKKQNIIIFSIFMLFILGFSLISCKKETIVEDIEVDEDETTVEVYKKYIDITLSGEVERTGTYNVPSYWTVKMLFEFAGVKDGGDISGYDLSLPIEENMIYHVPKIQQDLTAKSEKININTASKEQLMSIGGIGEVIATNIMSYRKTSPFKNIDEIKNVNGIGNAVYEKIKDFITV